MLQQMLDRRGTLSDTLRVALLGGAPAPDELIERCRDYSIPVYPTYGMTESASQITTATPRQTKGRLGTVGRPIFGTDVTVVDENGTPVEPGETGEIVVDGPTITPGYIDGAGAQRGPTTHAPGVAKRRRWIEHRRARSIVVRLARPSHPVTWGASTTRGTFTYSTASTTGSSPAERTSNPVR